MGARGQVRPKDWESGAAGEGHLVPPPVRPLSGRLTRNPRSPLHCAGHLRRWCGCPHAVLQGLLLGLWRPCGQRPRCSQERLMNRPGSALCSKGLGLLPQAILPGVVLGVDGFHIGLGVDRDQLFRDFVAEGRQVGEPGQMPPSNDARQLDEQRTGGLPGGGPGGRPAAAEPAGPSGRPRSGP